MSQDVVVPISPPELPEDLKKLIGAVEGFATSYNLLDSGLYSHTQLKVLKHCLAFQHSLYMDAIDNALAHPDWEVSPLLRQLKEGREQIEEAKKLDQ